MLGKVIGAGSGPNGKVARNEVENMGVWGHRAPTTVPAQGPHAKGVFLTWSTGYVIIALGNDIIMIH